MSFRYPAGLITASSPVNANYPSGVWTPRQALPYLQNNVWGQDPFFDQTTLLLHGDGTNGAQNNTFLDSSSNNFTITRNGNTTQGTFTPFSLAAGEWSNYFDGSGDYLSPPSNAAFQLGTGDFTIQFWVYLLSASTTQVFCDFRDLGNQTGIVIYSDSGTLKVNFNNSGGVLITGGSLTSNAWTLISLTRESGSSKLYINGVQSGSTASDTNNYSNQEIVIGSSFTPAQYTTGYISNFQVVKGSALTISLSTTPFTNVSGTSLLTCQSNRFVDNSTNNFAITRNGDVRVTPFSPFQPLLAYSPGVTGGSGYFDGSGDSLASTTEFEASTSTSTFTIEGWIYPTTFSQLINIIGGMVVLSGDEKSIAAEVNTSGQVALYWFDGAVKRCTGNSVMQLNAWNYFAIVVNSNAIAIYVNKTTADTLSGTTTLTNRTQWTDLGVGAYYNNNIPQQYFNGYLSNIRVSTVARTISSVPTAPLTSDADVRWLLNFTNAGIFDNTGKNNLETVGNAQIDTTTKKYGTGSMEFDGNGDFLTAPNSENFAFGTGDFTVEGWVNTSSLASEQTIFDSLPLGGIASRTTSFVLVIATDGKLRFYSNNAYSSSTSNSVTTGQWFHFAMVRSSGTIKIYINGTEGLSVANTTNFSNTGCVIGRYADAANGYFNGFIDDLRITKGIARYTANFVPPVARFPNQ